jgi:hypothetical protein
MPAKLMRYCLLFAVTEATALLDTGAGKVGSVVVCTIAGGAPASAAVSRPDRKQATKMWLLSMNQYVASQE